MTCLLGLFLGSDDAHTAHARIGLWTILGLLSFLTVEKVFPNDHDEEDDESDDVTSKSEERKAPGLKNVSRVVSAAKL